MSHKLYSVLCTIIFCLTWRSCDNFDVYASLKLLPHADCGTILPTDFIARGPIAHPGQFPWMAKINFYVRQYHKLLFVCTGSLISHRYVLTAAHCFTNFYEPGARIQVCLGCDHLEEIETYRQTIDAESLVINTKFDNKRWIHDIALIRLKGKAIFNAYVRPICLPILLTPEHFNMQTTFVVAGYGKTEHGDAKHLRHGMVLYQNSEMCSHVLKLPIDDRHHICAGTTNGVDTCVGDSGGPLMYIHEGRFFAVGVVSSGYGNCNQMIVSGIYTHVRSHMLWILHNMRP